MPSDQTTIDRLAALDALYGPSEFETIRIVGLSQPPAFTPIPVTMAYHRHMLDQPAPKRRNPKAAAQRAQKQARKRQRGKS